MTSPAALQTNETGHIISSGLQQQQQQQQQPQPQPQQRKQRLSLLSRAISPKPSRGSFRLPNEPSSNTTTLLPSVVSKSLFTTSPPRSGVNSPIPKRPSTGNLRNLQLQSSPDHKLTNT